MGLIVGQVPTSDSIEAVDMVRRALDYPYARAVGSFVLGTDGARALEIAWGEHWSTGAVEGESGLGGMEDEDRTPVLAYGSNAAPSALVRKFGGSPLVCLAACLRNMDVVYSAHLTRYGAVPAALQASPGTAVAVWVMLLTDAQIALLHGTEGLGINYGYARLDGIDLEADGLGRLEGVETYVSLHGCLVHDNAAVAIEGLQVEARRLQAMDQAGVQDLVMARMDCQGEQVAFIEQSVQQDGLRRARTAALKETAVPLDWPLVTWLLTDPVG